MKLCCAAISTALIAAFVSAGLCLAAEENIGASASARIYDRPFPAGTGVRGDALVLKTMGRDELLAYILDQCELALPEYADVWVQHSPELGYWDLPLRFKKSTQGPPTKMTDGYSAVLLYGLLLVERPQRTYAGKYDRQTLIGHLRDFQRLTESARVNARMHGHELAVEHVYDSLGIGEPDSKTARLELNPSTPQSRLTAFQDAQGRFRDTSFGLQRGFSGLSGLWNAEQIAQLPGSDRLDRYRYDALTYWSVPQDRAARWVELDDWSLADLRSQGQARLLPDFTTIEHGHMQWTYILNSPGLGHFEPFLLSAALAGFEPKQLPPPLNARAHPELCKGLVGYTRHFTRNFLSANGSVILPMEMEKYEQQLTFIPYSAWDAAVNRDEISAAYLSRDIQRVMWLLRRPFHPYGKVRAWYDPFAYVNYLHLVYYMVKQWGLPEDSPDWPEAQARDGGTTHFPYSGVTVHRNPYKVHQLYLGTNAKDGGFDRSTPKCNYSPTPWKPGHGMEFLQPFNFYDTGDVGSALELSTWQYERYAPFFACYGISRDELRQCLEDAKQKLDVTQLDKPDNPSLLGDYGADDMHVDPETEASHYWDDGFRTAMLCRLNKNRGVVHRALFSLGGRMSAVIEQSPDRQGRFAPLNFYVANLNAMSATAGWLPRVNWQIHLTDKTVAFAEYQHTEQHKPVVISPSARWYNIDDLVAVAVAEPQPLVLGTRQFPLVRDALYFGPSHGGGAVVYSGVESGRMPELADEVAMIVGLPDGWQGLQAQAPEGYRVYALARFGGQAARHEFEAAAPEGAPVFSVPTQITPEGRARAVFHLPKEFDTWSEETHFFITAAEGAPVSAQGWHHRLELTAGGGPAKVTVRFLGAATSERLRLTGAAGTPETIDAANFTTVGLTLELPADKAVYLSVEGAENADQTGPFVEITDPVFRGPNQPAMWRPIVGRHKFKAVAADRSGVAKVEFYLNDGRLIGVDDAAPYEVEHEVKDSFCQVVYAVAYDTLGNRRQSFEVPFGDGRVAAKGANGQ